MLPGGLEANCRDVLPIRQVITPASPVLVVRGPGEPIKFPEEEGVPQTRLTIKLPNLEPEREAEDGEGIFKLRTIRFKDWQGKTLRQEYPKEGQVTFRVNHDNLVLISREDWRYKPSLSEEIREELLAVVAVLGLGRDIPKEAEVWPLLEKRNEGSYVSGDLIVLCGTDAEWAGGLQETIGQMVGDQRSQEDVWKMAIALLARERFDKKPDILLPEDLVADMESWKVQAGQFGHH